MYVHISFRDAKLEKRVYFCHFYKFGKGHDGKIKEKHAKPHN